MDTYTRDGLTFDVSDTGPGDGPVVVALHGFPEDRHAWDRLTPALAEAGYRVLAPDQRGYSPGARPPRRRDYRVDALASDVLALADRVAATRFDVVGHDWGAVVAWELAMRHPDRVRSCTALAVPHPGAFAASLVRSSQLLHSWYMLAFQVPALPEWALARGGDRLVDRLARTGLDRSTAERYAARAGTAGAMTGPINWYRAIPLSAAARPRPVEVPTLFAWGARDPFVTRAAAERCAAWVRGPYRFLELPEGTHWLPTGAAGELAPAILGHLAAAGGDPPGMAGPPG